MRYSERNRKGKFSEMRDNNLHDSELSHNRDWGSKLVKEKKLMKSMNLKLLERKKIVEEDQGKVSPK